MKQQNLARQISALATSGHENSNKGNQENHNPPGNRQNDGDVMNDAFDRVDRVVAVLGRWI